MAYKKPDPNEQCCETCRWVLVKICTLFCDHKPLPKGLKREPARDRVVRERGSCEFWEVERRARE